MKNRGAWALAAVLAIAIVVGSCLLPHRGFRVAAWRVHWHTLSVSHLGIVPVVPIRDGDVDMPEPGKAVCLGVGAICCHQVDEPGWSEPHAPVIPYH